MGDEERTPRVRYVGHNPETKRLIEEVIAQLPREVAKFAAAKCAFVSLGTGRVMSLRDNRHLILLPRDFTRADLCGPSVIAHEIAHVWLQHQGDGDDEMAVVRQCQLWGCDTTGGWKDRPPEDSRRVAREIMAAAPDADLDLEVFERPWPHEVFCDRAMVAQLPELRRRLEAGAAAGRARAERQQLVSQYINPKTTPPELDSIVEKLCDRADDVIGKARTQDRPKRRRRFMQTKARAWKKGPVYLSGQYIMYGLAASLPVPLLDLWVFEDVASVLHGKRRRTQPAVAEAVAVKGTLAQPRALGAAAPPRPRDRDKLGS